MPVRHVVTFVWNDDVTPEHVERFGAALAELPGLVPTIRAYAFGPDAGLNSPNSDYAVTADFDDDEGYLVYRDHPDHRRVIEQFIAGHVASRAAVQFRTA
jgi:hypothetical protein